MTTLCRVRPCRTETRTTDAGRCGKAAPYDRTRWTHALAAAVLVGVFAASPAAACPVCYGEASGDVIDGAKLSILFLGGLVYTVIGGAVGVVLALRRRVRKNLDARRGLHLVPSSGEGGRGGGVPFPREGGRGIEGEGGDPMEPGWAVELEFQPCTLSSGERRSKD